MSGKVRIGSTVTGASRRRSLSRVMHIRRGLPVDLGRAGTAFPGFAVPADGEIVRLFGLDLVDGVEHHHPG